MHICFGAHAHVASIIRKGLEQNQSTPVEYAQFLNALTAFYTPQWHQYLFTADVCKIVIKSVSLLIRVTEWTGRGFESHLVRGYRSMTFLYLYYSLQV